MAKAIFHYWDTQFNKKSSFEQEVPESVLIEQMNKPKNKRNYTYGIEFSVVERIEILKGDQ